MPFRSMHLVAMAPMKNYSTNFQWPTQNKMLPVVERIMFAPVNLCEKGSDIDSLYKCCSSGAEAENDKMPLWGFNRSEARIGHGIKLSALNTMPEQEFSTVYRLSTWCCRYGERLLPANYSTINYSF